MSEIEDWQALISGAPDATTEVLDPGFSPRRPVLPLVQDKKPDEEARKRKLGIETGLNPDVIEVDPDSVERAKKIQDWNSLLDAAPVTSKQFEEPAFAAQAQDSIEQLSKVEHTWGLLNPLYRDIKTIGNLGAGLAESTAQAAAGLSRGIDAAGKLPGLYFSIAEGITWKNQEEAAKNVSPLTDIAKHLENVDLGYAPQTTFEDWKEHPLASFLPFALETGLMSIPDMSLALASMPTLAVSLGGRIAQTRAENNEQTDATFGDMVAAMPAAIASALLDRLGGRSVFGIMDALIEPGAKAVATAVGISAVKEGGTEFIQSGLESAAGTIGTKAGFNPTQTFEDALSGAVAGVGFGGTVRAITASAESMALARKAIRTETALKLVKEQLEESPLTKRAPDVAASHVAEVMRESGSDGVFINASKLSEYAQEAGIDTVEFYAKLGVDSQIEEAMATGGEVRMAEEAFVEHIMLTDAFLPLSAHVRTKEDELTADEAKQVPEQINENIAQNESDVELENQVVEATELLPGDVAQQAKDVALASKAITFAEREAGLQGIIDTAAGVGLEGKSLESWLTVVQQAAEAPRKRMADRILKQRQRENSEEFKIQLANQTALATEIANSQQVYSSINDIGRDRLSRDQVIAIIGEDNLNLLPKHDDGRAIYTNNTGETGIDPEVYALDHGYDSAKDMLEDMLTSPDKQQLITSQAKEATRAAYENMLNENQLLEAARAELQVDDTAELLALELELLSEARKEGRLKRPLLKRYAKTQLRKRSIKEATRHMPFFNRSAKMGKESAKLLKKGDREGAVQAKLQQLLNFEYGLEAVRLSKILPKQIAWMQEQAEPTKPRKEYKTTIDAREELRNIISAAGFDPANPGGMTLSAWNDLYTEAKEFYNLAAGVERLSEKQGKQKVQDIVDWMVESMPAPIVTRSIIAGRGGIWNQWENDKISFKLLKQQLGTITRELDGWAYDGPFYTVLKGWYDKAFRGQFLKRHRESQQALSSIFDSIIGEKGLQESGRKIRVEGVSSRINMTRQTVWSILLNSGNSYNLAALIKGGPFTELEIKAVHDYANTQDIELVNALHAYLDSFWPDIKSSVERRTGTLAERVEADPLNLKNGILIGGYYPLVANKATAYTGEGLPIENVFDKFMRSTQLSRHTRDGHTKSRTDFSGQEVSLDMHVIEHHIRQVVYDLEMGDAVRDIAKVLYHPDLKKAFNSNGSAQIYKALQKHFQAMVTGEIYRGDSVSRWLRHGRQGYAMFAMGLNFTVVALQPLGLVNTMLKVGKLNVLNAALAVLQNKPWGPNNYLDDIFRVSEVMVSRAEAAQSDLESASHMMRDGLLDQLGSGIARFARAAPYYALRKMQFAVDVISWLAAKQHGLELFNGDEALANNHADSIVESSQGSRHLMERSLLEQGTTNAVEQEELVKVLTPFISYFMAKENAFYEVLAKTEKTPIGYVGLAGNVLLGYVLEATAVSLMYGFWPDYDEDEPQEEYAQKVALEMVKQTISLKLAGAPVLRNFASEAAGFRGGGSLSAVYNKFGNLTAQLQQDDWDIPAIKSANTMAGIAFHYPAGPINRLFDAQNAHLEDEDLKWADWIGIALTGKNFWDRHTD